MPVRPGSGPAGRDHGVERGARDVRVQEGAAGVAVASVGGVRPGLRAENADPGHQREDGADAYGLLHADPERSGAAAEAIPPVMRCELLRPSDQPENPVRIALRVQSRAPGSQDRPEPVEGMQECATADRSRRAV